MRRFVGIDPGLGGGLAVLELDPDLGGGRRVRLVRTPVVWATKRGKRRREYDVPAMLFELVRACNGLGRPAIVLELAGPRPAPAGLGGQGRGTVGAFRSGVGLGLWHALAVTTGKPLHFVAPIVWKKHAGLLGADKAASRLRAAELYPEVGRLGPADEGPAEALLMAAWLATREGAPERTNGHA